jgi:hypothetical protein
VDSEFNHALSGNANSPKDLGTEAILTTEPPEVFSFQCAADQRCMVMTRSTPSNSVEHPTLTLHDAG